MGAADFWIQAWQRKGWFNRVLYPLSLLAERWWHGQRQTTRAQALPVPLVVVGNLWPGGAGKTPLVMTLVQGLQRRGWSVGVISRGHGRQSSKVQLLGPDDSALTVGDEPLLIHQRTGAPVAVGARRIEAARALLRAHPKLQVIISDDGLQHLALAHDIALCVWDERGLGNGWMLPAGPLREPWPRAPRAQQLELHLNAPDQAQVAGYPMRRELAPWAVNGHGQRRGLSELAHQPLHATCGIAKPKAFFQALREAGLTLAQTQSWPDHHRFNHWSPSPYRADQWLCTEKDAVKIWPHHPGVWAVPLTCELPDAAWTAIEQALQAALRSRHGSKTA
jgi:tetraacyldisaccharide 4'-kinase